MVEKRESIVRGRVDVTRLSWAMWGEREGKQEARERGTRCSSWRSKVQS